MPGSHPDWWLNLLAEPHATVLISGESIPVMAHEGSEPERSNLFARFVSETDESYLEYQRRTSRRLPVVALLRAGPAAPAS
jgi:deazaflavin-dependent oxidoreductase (nitroreductase family)